MPWPCDARFLRESTPPSPAAAGEGGWEGEGRLPLDAAEGDALDDVALHEDAADLHCCAQPLHPCAKQGTGVTAQYALALRLAELRSIHLAEDVVNVGAEEHALGTNTAHQHLHLVHVGHAAADMRVEVGAVTLPWHPSPIRPQGGPG